MSEALALAWLAVWPFVAYFSYRRFKVADRLKVVREYPAWWNFPAAILLALLAPFTVWPWLDVGLRLLVCLRSLDSARLAMLRRDRLVACGFLFLFVIFNPVFDARGQELRLLTDLTAAVALSLSGMTARERAIPV